MDDEISHQAAHIKGKFDTTGGFIRPPSNPKVPRIKWTCKNDRTLLLFALGREVKPGECIKIAQNFDEKPTAKAVIERLCKLRKEQLKLLSNCKLGNPEAPVYDPDGNEAVYDRGGVDDDREDEAGQGGDGDNHENADDTGDDADTVVQPTPRRTATSRKHKAVVPASSQALIPSVPSNAPHRLSTHPEMPPPKRARYEILADSFTDEDLCRQLRVSRKNLKPTFTKTLYDVPNGHERLKQMTALRKEKARQEAAERRRTLQSQPPSLESNTMEIGSEDQAADDPTAGQSNPVMSQPPNFNGSPRDSMVFKRKMVKYHKEQQTPNNQAIAQWNTQVSQTPSPYCTPRDHEQFKRINTEFGNENHAADDQTVVPWNTVATQPPTLYSVTHGFEYLNRSTMEMGNADQAADGQPVAQWNAISYQPPNVTSRNPREHFHHSDIVMGNESQPTNVQMAQWNPLPSQLPNVNSTTSEHLHHGVVEMGNESQAAHHQVPQWNPITVQLPSINSIPLERYPRGLLGVGNEHQPANDQASQWNPILPQLPNITSNPHGFEHDRNTTEMDANIGTAREDAAHQMILLSKMLPAPAPAHHASMEPLARETPLNAIEATQASGTIEDERANT